ncbi:uncharacterized protein METZ01_LOCUS81693 [marine metagenome]|uniref:Formamidopyrimidine-DNA glycosylase catalytic domain-containing protein n=1 Tax=marine metagenome TaxID=408172 RepID=A0A381UL33_9ZZZZ
MPELPEVETTVKSLNILIGLKVYKVKIYTNKLRYIIPKSIIKIQKDSKIINIQRIAKYILIHFSSNFSIVVHLGMSGRLKMLSELKKRNKHDHFVIYFKNSKILVLNDPRKFGFIDFDHTKKIYSKKYLTVLGIDALSKKLNTDYIYKKINKSEVPIKQILLNQHIVSGIGNIYASEILFDSKISPFTKGKDLNTHQLTRLIKSMRKILVKAIKYGGSTIRDYVASDGTLGNFQSHFSVYNKEGKKISKFAIKKVLQYGRSTYYCPGLQKNKKN